MGYHRAGWEVVGVDIRLQPHYPFEFHQADALTFPLEGFDAIHASPPCQLFTRFQASQPQRVNGHRNLIAPLRERLAGQCRPWVIENVPGAPLRAPVQLCGTSFGLGVGRGQLWRHRLFEASVALEVPPCRHDGRPAVMVTGHGKDGYRGSGLAAAEAREAMRIDWMNRDELAQAIPPDYTEWIGRQLLAAA